MSINSSILQKRNLLEVKSHTTCRSKLIADNYIIHIYNMSKNKYIATAIRSWPASCSTFVSYHRCCQHNGQ